MVGLFDKMLREIFLTLEQEIDAEDLLLTHHTEGGAFLLNPQHDHRGIHGSLGEPASCKGIHFISPFDADHIQAVGDLPKDRFPCVSIHPSSSLAFIISKMRPVRKGSKKPPVLFGT